MSSQANNHTGDSRAEKAFREAFERLKTGQPVRLAKRTRVSQNNVAKEAGCDPSALKKARYPALIAEIQAWLRDNPAAVQPSSSKRIIGQRNKNLTLQNRIDELIAERDHCASLLAGADAHILELVRKVAQLEAMLPANVIGLAGAKASRADDVGLPGLVTDSIKGSRSRSGRQASSDQPETK